MTEYVYNTDINTCKGSKGTTCSRTFLLGIPVLRGKRPFAFSQTSSLGFFQWKVGETFLYIGNSKITYYNREFRV